MFHTACAAPSLMVLATNVCPTWVTVPPLLEFLQNGCLFTYFLLSLRQFVKKCKMGSTKWVIVFEFAMRKWMTSSQSLFTFTGNMSQRLLCQLPWHQESCTSSSRAQNGVPMWYIAIDITLLVPGLETMYQVWDPCALHSVLWSNFP